MRNVYEPAGLHYRKKINKKNVSAQKSRITKQNGMYAQLAVWPSIFQLSQHPLDLSLYLQIRIN